MILWLPSPRPENLPQSHQHSQMKYSLEALGLEQLAVCERDTVQGVCFKTLLQITVWWRGAKGCFLWTTLLDVLATEICRVVIQTHDC